VRARARAHGLENKFHISFSSCALLICDNIIRHIIFFYALYRNAFVQFLELPVCGTYKITDIMKRAELPGGWFSYQISWR